MSAIQNTPAYYDNYTFEPWAQAIGWLMMAVPIALIFVVGIVQFCRLGWPACIRPAKDWGPSQPEDRTGRYAEPGDQNGMTMDNVAYEPDQNDIKDPEKINIRL